MLPQMDKPRILDIGCGSGVPTLELAMLSHGDVIGVDIDQPALNRFSRKIGRSGLTQWVKAIKCSLLNMNFPDASFDIIWAEGSISVIGFEKGLKEWYRFLKSGGFLVVHDALGNLTEKLRQITTCGYELLDHFILDENVWRNEYYTPLDEQLNKLREKHIGTSATLKEMENDQHEIDALKREPENYRSVFFVMRKR